jgi:hypothetical protein
LPQASRILIIGDGADEKKGSMKHYVTPEITASYTMEPNPLAAFPPGTIVPIRQDLIPQDLMERVCAHYGLTLVGTDHREFADGIYPVYLVHVSPH